MFHDALGDNGGGYAEDSIAVDGDIGADGEVLVPSLAAAKSQMISNRFAILARRRKMNRKRHLFHKKILNICSPN